jgi:hypothetical protein
MGEIGLWNSAYHDASQFFPDAFSIRVKREGVKGDVWGSRSPFTRGAFC